jgi:signal transduction histidine kinase
MPEENNKVISQAARIFVCSFMFIVAMLLADFYILSIKLKNEESNAAFVEVSGQLRMLIQRVSLLSLALASARESELRLRFREEISIQLDLMERAYLGLIDGNTALNLPSSDTGANMPASVARVFFQPPLDLGRNIDSFFLNVRGLLSSSSEELGIKNPFLEQIVHSSSSLVENLRILTELYREQGQSGIQELRTFKLVNLTLIIVALLIIVTVIFIPLLRKFHNEFSRREKAEVELRASARTLMEKTHELSRSNAGLEQFALIIAHDLKAPLTSINAFLKLISEELEEKSIKSLREPLTYIERATLRMQSMIADLLSFSRVSQENQLFSLVDLNLILSEILEDLTPTIRHIDAQVRVENLPVITADPIQMRQLFQNLVSNSLKFRQTDKALLIHVKACSDATGDYALLRFKDNGIGFNSSVQEERIFQIFRRLEGSEAFEGSGVGLAICKKIVERHSGEIFVKSRPGGGSLFTVKLPYHQLPALKE